ncbi:MULTISPECIES: hypothetical protein [unclassified Micromonospora]|uniref:hypothetical protein n=1 Tax=unclassified Micromonospora TaxID=2617518 RepID=UPI00332780F2
MTTVRLVIVVLSLAMIGFGVRVAVSRRVPVAWVRVARLTARQRSQPVRMGVGQALLGACLLVQQAPFLIPMPHSVGVALLVVSLLLALTAVGWFAVPRR